jgi:hypothetical protein
MSMNGHRLIIRPQSGSSRLVLVAQRWCRITANVPGPTPPASMLGAMLDQLVAGCEHTRARPIDLAVASWKRPEGVAADGGNDFLSRIAIGVEPGTSAQSLRSWFQWQHPLWIWEDGAFPLAAAIEGEAG